jgi:hypothetical protein
LEKLHFAAAAVCTSHNQALAAGLAFFLRKGTLPAVGAGDIRRPAATGADRLALRHLAQTGWTGIPKGRSAPAGGAKPGVPVQQAPAMDTGLFVKSHLQSSRLLCSYYTKWFKKFKSFFE